MLNHEKQVNCEGNESIAWNLQESNQKPRWQKPPNWFFLPPGAAGHADRVAYLSKGLTGLERRGGLDGAFPIHDKSIVLNTYSSVLSKNMWNEWQDLEGHPRVKENTGEGSNEERDEMNV